MTNANKAGLYFVDAAGKLVEEGSPKAVQQFLEEDLRSQHLGPYANVDEIKSRELYAERKAKADAEKAIQRADEAAALAAASVSPVEHALRARIAELEEQAKARSGSANKAVTSAPNK